MNVLDWLRKQSPYTLVGLAGVEESDSLRAKSAARIFSILMVVVAIWLLFQWELEMLHHLTLVEQYIANGLVWLFFVIELLILTALAQRKWHFLKHNWMLVAIVILGIGFVLHIPVITDPLRNLRPFLAIYIMIPSFAMLLSFFIDGQLSTTLIAASIIVVVFGLLVDGVDPNIKSAWDGIWWALATVSTVGYGDVVPTSALGRILGGVLVVLGLGIFVVITANFLALILRKESPKARAEQEEIIEKYVKSLYAGQHEIINRLDKIEEDLQQLKKDD